jgi:hypothetical protein
MFSSQTLIILMLGDFGHSISGVLKLVLTSTTVLF